jgi:hypothetical protein
MMVSRLYSLSASLVAALYAVPLSAQTVCTATVLHDVRAQEDSTAILRVGQKFDSIAQFWKYANGRTYFCQKGGYCYDGDTVENGKVVPSMKLDNCTIDSSSADRDEDGNTLYYLNVNRAKADPSSLRKYDIESRLVELGLCSACADNAATVYIEEPTSVCAITTRSALEGSVEARDQLVRNIEICSEPASKIYESRESGSDQ